MNLHVFYVHINIIVFLLCASALEPGEIDSDSEVQDASEDMEAIHGTHMAKFNKGQSFKRNIRKKRATENKSSNKECAIMYKNDQPVGVLQPFKDSYQLLPIHPEETIPVDINPLNHNLKRDASNDQSSKEEPQESEQDEEILQSSDDESQFADGRYPYIFAKFKIDSRIEKPEGIKTKQKIVTKRESKNSLLSEKHADSLKSTLSRIETNDEGAEVELQNILSDMGLIEDENRIDKRQADLEEDEDLEHGTNKINMIRLDDNFGRLKREEEEDQALKSDAGTKHIMSKIIPEPKAPKQENEDVPQDNIQEDQMEQTDDKERQRRSEKVAKEMERQIKDRLQKIKEEVRHEIEKIKSGGNEEFEETDGSDENAEPKENTQRKKRNALSTLVDEESRDIDPLFNSDNSLVPYVRRRRSTDEENEEIHDTTKNETSQNTNENKNEDNNESHLNKETVSNNTRPRSKTRQESLETYNMVLNRIQELERQISNKNQDYTPVAVPIENHFLFRNLKEYDEEQEAINDHENEVTNIKKKNHHNIDKRACKCNPGQKDCKCQKSPKLTQEGSLDYIDGMLALGPKSHSYQEQLIEPEPEALMMPKPIKLDKSHKSILSTLKNGKYHLDLHPDTYRITEQDPKLLAKRFKRDSFTDLVAIHGGAPLVDHLIAIRQRSMLPRMRRKRMAKSEDKTDKLTLTDMSDEDLFGPLTQGFEGELARFKRVKRRAKT